VAFPDIPTCSSSQFCRDQVDATMVVTRKTTQELMLAVHARAQLQDERGKESGEGIDLVYGSISTTCSIDVLTARPRWCLPWSSCSASSAQLLASGVPRAAESAPRNCRSELCQGCATGEQENSIKWFMRGELSLMGRAWESNGSKHACMHPRRRGAPGRTASYQGPSWERHASAHDHLK
jgi:hypothetical protein